MKRPWFRHVAAPMVGQSDLPFRLTAVQYGATATWTCVAADRQMFHTRDIDDRDTRETLVRALEIGRAAPEARDIDTGERTPQIVQLAGDCPDALVRAARAVPGADGFDINLGCPQKRARDGHYGGYLLAGREWPLVEQLGACMLTVAALAQSVDVPVCAKIRLCDTARETPELAKRVAHAGADIVTLHARHVAPNRRRGGAAKLEYVAAVVDTLEAAGLHASRGGRTHVITNGGVRGYEDVARNMALTRADGAMVGEPLLGAPDIFRACGDALAPLVTYLDNCVEYGVDAPHVCVQQHARSMVAARLAPGRETRALADALAAAPTASAMRLCLSLPPRGDHT